MDWGSASPFSVGWWAIVQDDFETDGRVLPRGCMVRYREWYGMKSGQPNVGLKINAEQVGMSIAAREKDDKISYGVLDPSAFAEDGGPSIAERLSRGSANKIHFRRADNTRVPRHGAMGGWDQLRARLVGDGEGRPMIVTFSTCVDSIRTIPFLQHDPDRAEDIMTDSEDHAADEWRYAMSGRSRNHCRHRRMCFTSERGGPMSAKSFGTLFERLGRRAGMPFTIFPHMLRHACGYALANAGHDTRALQAWLGHKNIQHTVRYTELAPDRFKNFWRD